MKAIFGFAVVLFSLVVTAPRLAAQSGGDYPVKITNPKVIGVYPATAAGYTRGEMHMFAADMKDYSIAYDIEEPAAHNAVTLYFYEAPETLATLFESGKGNILTLHPDAKLVSETPLVLKKNGKSYPAFSAIFRFSGNFRGNEQPVFSQLVVTALPTRYFKVRSTGPWSEAEALKEKTRQLVEALDWTK